MDINKEFKFVRMQKKMSQVEFSNILGISSSLLSNIELGKTEPSETLINKLRDISSDDIPSIGTVIRISRTIKGLTQEELAKEVNCTQAAVTAWEVDKTIPSIDKIKDICNFFNVSACELIGLVCYEEDSNLYHEIRMYSELNQLGKTRVIEYIKDTLEIKKYRK